MSKCLICGKENAQGPDTCKLCGMRMAGGVKEGGFLFCCGRCVEHFRRIYGLSSIRERRKMLESKAVI